MRKCDRGHPLYTTDADDAYCGTCIAEGLVASIDEPVTVELHVLEGHQNAANVYPETSYRPAPRGEPVPSLSYEECMAALAAGAEAHRHVAGRDRR